MIKEKKAYLNYDTLENVVNYVINKEATYGVYGGYNISKWIDEKIQKNMKFFVHLLDKRIMMFRGTSCKD